MPRNGKIPVVRTVTVITTEQIDSKTVTTVETTVTTNEDEETNQE